MRTDPVDLVYSTSPHATAHLVALALVRSARVPWVTDFRDPWYEEPPEPGTLRVVHWAGRHLERRVIRRAARVVASTEQLRDALATRYRIPAISYPPLFAELGGLISYGVDFAELFRQAAGYVDRIFKGAKPADLPVQLPSKLVLVINKKTAKGLGLTVPLTLQASANEVIE